jgi:hypothetical protein
VLPVLLRHNVAFWLAFAVSCLVTAGAYFVLVWGLGRFGVRL